MNELRSIERNPNLMIPSAEVRLRRKVASVVAATTSVVCSVLFAFEIGSYWPFGVSFVALFIASLLIVPRTCAKPKVNHFLIFLIAYPAGIGIANLPKVWSNPIYILIILWWSQYLIREAWWPKSR